MKPSKIRSSIKEYFPVSMIRFLPKMQTDIFLQYRNQILIIDAKYYQHTLQKHYDKSKLHSDNMYQIFAYVKNQDKDGSGNVSGMLLYAKTEERIVPDCNFMMGGNKISVKTLDLNKEFSLIKAQLDQIAEEHFGKRAKEISPDSGLLLEEQLYLR